MPLVQCTKCGCDVHLTEKEGEVYDPITFLCDDCYDDEIHSSSYDHDEFSDTDSGL